MQQTEFESFVHLAPGKRGNMKTISNKANFASEDSLGIFANTIAWIDFSGFNGSETQKLISLLPYGYTLEADVSCIGAQFYPESSAESNAAFSTVGYKKIAGKPLIVFASASSSLGGTLRLENITLKKNSIPVTDNFRLYIADGLCNSSGGKLSYLSESEIFSLCEIISSPFPEAKTPQLSGNKTNKITFDGIDTTCTCHTNAPVVTIDNPSRLDIGFTAGINGRQAVAIAIAVEASSVQNTNTAVMRYKNRNIASNMVTSETNGSFTVVKTALTPSYWRESEVLFRIEITNNTGADLNGVLAFDTLGLYGYGEPQTAYYPLNYINGSITQTVNGQSLPPPSVDTSGVIMVIRGISIPSAASAVITYRAEITVYAPLSAGSVITNDVSVATTTLPFIYAKSQATLNVKNTTSLNIIKTACPETVAGSEAIDFSFYILNSGNMPAGQGDNTVIADTFTPPIQNISVELNAQPLIYGTDYTYDPTSGNFATTSGVITVLQAEFTQNTQAIVVATPGVSVLTVSGSYI